MSVCTLTLPCITFLDSLAVYTAAEMTASVRAIGSRILLISTVTAHIISDAINLLQTQQLIATMASMGCRHSSPADAGTKNVQSIMFKMFIICNTDCINSLKHEVYINNI
jgi:hypothetical protein